MHGFNYNKSERYQESYHCQRWMQYKGKGKSQYSSPKTFSQTKGGERDATSEFTQNDQLYPKSQRTHHSSLKANAPTVQHIMDTTKKVCRLEKKREWNIKSAHN